MEPGARQGRYTKGRTVANLVTTSCRRFWLWAFLLVCAGCEAIGKATGGSGSFVHDVGAAIDDVLEPVAGPFWPALGALGAIAAGVIVRRRRRRRRGAVGATAPKRRR